MLGFYQRLATRLYPLRAVIVVLAIITAGGFAAVLFGGEQVKSEFWLLLLLVSFIFLLCLRVLIAFFAGTKKSQGGRLKRFLLWVWQWLLVCVLSAVLLLWFFLFVRALSAIIRQLL